MKHTKPAPALTLLALLTLTIAGCGTSTNTTTSGSATSASTTSANTPTSAPPPAGTPVTAINAICTKRNQQIAALATTIDTQAAIKHAAQTHAAIEQNTLTQLEKLTVPTTLQPTWHQYLANRRTLIKALHTLAKHGLNNNTHNTFIQYTTVEEKLRSTATQNQLTQCAQPGYENLSR